MVPRTTQSGQADGSRALSEGATEDLPILLVDDETSVLKAVRRMLAMRGYHALTAERASVALDLLAEREFAAIVSDYRMPEMDGVTLLSTVRDRWPLVERILLTAHADLEALERGVNDAGVHRILHKPCSADVLVPIVDESLKRSRLRRENAVLVERLKNRNEELDYLNKSLVYRATANDEALQVFRRRWDAALNAISDPVVIITDALRIEGVNLATERLAGAPFSALEGRACHEALFGAPERCAGCPIPKGLGRVSPRLGGRLSHFEAHAYALAGERTAYLCLYENITARAAFEEQANHLEKMAALGRLAGGVAHEINNPLQAILSFVQLAGKPDVAAEKLARYHEVIRESALRCRDIVLALKSFSRRDGPAEKTKVDLTAVAKKVLTVFSPLADRALEVLPKDAPPLATIGDAGQLQQVLVNLVQNAVDATASGGKIQIALAALGDEVAVSVDDDGPGVPEAERARIFEPFYTTKPEGVGTGLGLSISDRIVRDHGGFIKIGAGPLGGAHFEVRLRAAREGEDHS